jgi:hypothetical protein
VDRPTHWPAGYADDSGDQGNAAPISCG